MNTDIVLIKIFLFLLLLSFSLTDKYNKGTYNIICADKDIGCIFTISTNYPISLKIPNIIPEETIIGDYRYNYLLFNDPHHNLKTFYLEVYYTSN